jgi:hypothetical protein
VSGKTQEWKTFAKELKGAKKKDYMAMLKRGGIEHELVCLQHTPQGDFVVVYDEGKNVSKWAGKLAASKEPFDKWFMKKIGELHGLTGPETPPIEVYVDTCDF